MRAMRFYAGVLVALCSCSPAPSGDFVFGGPDDELGGSTGRFDASSGEDTTGTSGAHGESQDLPELRLDAGPPDAPSEAPAVVYGQDAETLWRRLDPETLELVRVGDFSGCQGSVIDIAVDRAGAMVAATYDSLWSVDPSTGECSWVADGMFPTSLSYIPAGLLGDYEALVGFVAGGTYVEIDPETGRQYVLGHLPPGLESSGDVVSVEGGPTWLTVRGAGCEDQDCLVELDPATGELVAAYGRIGFDQVYGLAAWGGRAYGFAREGVVFEVQVPGPLTTVISEAGPEWFGAGSSTLVPAG